MRRIATILTTACLLCLLVSAQNAPAPGTPAPNAPPKLTEAGKAAVVAKLAGILTEKYVFPETGMKMADLLRSNLQAGAYATLERPDDFAGKLTEDMQSISRDKHLHVAYNPGAGWLSWSKNVDEEQQRLEKRRSRTDNYGFREVKILPGNVGYLKFDYFSGNPEAFPVAVGAMAFVSGADALVFDLRDNGGGDPQMIQLLTTYLYEGEPKHLNSFYHREGDRTEQFWTLPYVPGQRLPAVPVYVLTSERTFSGAEEFSYNLKNLKRATIVGETTGGGAHPVNREPIDDDFWVSVPYARAVNPISKTNWEGTGVEPDVKIPADKALDTALAMALEKLSEEEKDARFNDYYRWFLTAQKAKVSPVTLTEADLQAYAGTYGPRRILLEGGSLFYQREGRPKFKMIPLTADTFAFEELPAFRLKFLREGNRVTAVEGCYQDGRKDPSPRTE